MTDVSQPTLEGWANFYVIVGSSGAALTGLQFVVLTLVAERRRISNLADINAFGTPTIVHFCSALLVSAILSAPWSRLGSAAVTLGVLGLSGLTYTMIVSRRAGQGEYKPVFADWLWHAMLPALSYLTIVVCAVVVPRGSGWPFFGIAGAALLLLFIGIHNARDTVLYIVTTPRQGVDGSSPPNTM